jgi:hypothetical protein
MGAFAGSPWGGRSRRRDGEMESPAPSTASAGRLGGVGPSTLRRHSDRRVSYEDGPPASPHERGEPPITSSSPHYSHAWQAPATATMSLQPRWRHKALTHDPLKEIRRKTLSNRWNQLKDENTKEAPKRPTEITTPNLLYNQERFIQGLACLLNTHPSLKISP